MDIPSKHYNNILTFMEEVNFSKMDVNKLLINFKEIFGYSQSIFWLCEKNFKLMPVTQLNIEQNAIDEYNTYYHKLDGYWHPRNILPWPQKQNVLKIFDVIEEDRYVNTTLYQQFFLKYNHHHIMTMYFLYKANLFGFITFTREKQDIPFNDDDSKQMEVISRFLSWKIWDSFDLDEINMKDKFYKASPFKLQNLTLKELEVLKLVQRGLSNSDVSSELFISINTVKTHLLSIYRKLNVSNRTELCYKVNRREIL
jgi:DNA-binding CsgD family transcriptional regulator